MVDEHRERLEQLVLGVHDAGRRDRQGGREVEATPEDAQAPEERRLPWWQERDAPGDRVTQGALSVRDIDRSTGEDAETLLEAGQQGGGGEEPHPRGGELEREGQPIEAPADGPDSASLRPVEDAARSRSRGHAP